MKAVLTKSLVVLAGAVLVLPFAAVALIIAARAAAGVEGGGERLLLAALAIGGALLSGTIRSKRDVTGVANETAAREVTWIEDEAHPYVRLRVRW